jgi:DNA repair protein RadC
MNYTDQQLEKLIAPKLREAALQYARMEEIKRTEDKDKIASSSDIIELLRPYYYNLDVEYFYCVFLNRANKVLAIELISQGGMTATVVDQRVIFRKALLNKATSIILSHNHPSGNNQPSEQDIQLTKNIKKSGDILDIRILDHVIISGNLHYSFADQGII